MQQAADLGMAAGEAIHGSKARCAFSSCLRMILENSCAMPDFKQNDCQLVISRKKILSNPQISSIFVV
jgi:hypothetical protein